jgi:hypothetical protein
MKLRLDRSKLIRGSLFSKEGGYCPLGKLILTSSKKGVKEIESKSTICIYTYIHKHFPKLDTYEVYSDNDNLSLTTKQKEARITVTFAHSGIEVEYFGKYNSEYFK